MTVPNYTNAFRGWLRMSVLIVLLSTGAAALTSCTVAYTPSRRPVPPPPEPEVVYVEPAPTAFPELERYGRWVEVDNAGWAWSPDVNEGWRPYYYGQWAWANAEWTWMSYEPYGWAVYHYGNWAMDPYWGWLWFPGYEWQPNTVTWVVQQDYIAWAPAPHYGYAVGDPWSYEYARAWNVSHVRDFTSPYVGDYLVVGFARHQRRVHRYVITYAPEPSYIYQRGGGRVTPVSINMRPVAGHRRGLERMYWPQREQVRLKKHRTRTYKELYDPRSRPTPMTRPGIPDVDPDVSGRGRGDGPTPMTRPDPRDVEPRTPNDRPTPMTRPDVPDVDRNDPNDGPIIITPPTDVVKRQSKRMRPNRQDPGKRDNRGKWGRPGDTKPNRQDPDKKDLKDGSKPNRQDPDKKNLKDDSKSKRPDSDDKDDKNARDKDKKGKKGDSDKDNEKSDDKNAKSKKGKDKDSKDNGKDDKGKDSKDKDSEADDDSDEDDTEDKDRSKGKKGGKGKK